MTRCGSDDTAAVPAELAAFVREHEGPFVVAEGRVAGIGTAISMGFEGRRVAPAHPSVALVAGSRWLAAIARQPAGRPVGRIWEAPVAGITVEAGRDRAAVAFGSRAAADWLVFLPAAPEVLAELVVALVGPAAGDPGASR